MRAAEMQGASRGCTGQKPGFFSADSRAPADFSRGGIPGTIQGLQFMWVCLFRRRGG